MPLPPSTSPSGAGLGRCPATADAAFAAAAATTRRRVAAEVAAVLARATDADLHEASLTLPLALSVCMERHGARPEDVIAAMQVLRDTVLAVSGLDPASEPVPLIVGEPATAAVRLALYLHGLVGRAARAMDGGPDVVAAAASAALGPS